MAHWEKDKTALLSSLEDLSLYKFDEVTYLDAAHTMIASFESFVPGDLISNGSLALGPYDSSVDLSANNSPYLVYKDDNNQGRVHFYFNVTKGNLSGSNYLLDMDLGGMLPNFAAGKYRVYASTPALLYWDPDASNRDGEDEGPQPGAMAQVPGKVTLCNLSDDPEFGIEWSYLWSEADLNNTSSWSYTVEAWNDAEVTINKADFWNRDKINQET